MHLWQWIIDLYLDERTRERLAREGKTTAGFRGALHVLRGHFQEFTLYNPLGLLAALVFFVNAFRPWWYAALYERYYFIWAYPFILRHDLPSDAGAFIIETPLPAVALLIYFILAYLFLALWGSTMAGKKGRWFTACAGFFMLLHTAGFYGSLLFATHRVGLPVTGYSSVAATVQIDINMHWLPAYGWAIGAAAVCLLSPLIHGRWRIPRRPCVRNHGV